MTSIGVVLLHPLGLEGVHPQRMGQVHPGSDLLAGIHGPVPAMRGLQHHLRRLPAGGQQLLESLRIVLDSVAREHLALGVHPYHHRPPAVQVDSDVLWARHLGVFPPWG